MKPGALSLLILVLAATPALARKPTAEEARAFTARVEAELKAKDIRSNTADWLRETYINDDSERLSAAMSDELLGFRAASVHEAARFAGLKLDADTARKLTLLRTSAALAAPSDPARRLELTTLAGKMIGAFGAAKACGADGKGPCRDLEELTGLFARSRSYDELLDAWVGWHRTARPLRPMFARFVELANAGARELGFADTGAMWRSGYDVPPEDFAREVDRLYEQVRPLYQDLHCYVRARLRKTYGDRVPAHGPIPAHLLGNMWAQDWTNLYPLVEPYPGKAALDVTAALEQQRWDAVKMMKTGEGFFTSLGLPSLPASFWARSMLVKPRDREVVCHASAWDVLMNGDVRIKMCTKPTEEDLSAIHHELGHVYYDLAYKDRTRLYQEGANGGFHEAIGDAITLSMTPAYLQRLGLVDRVVAGDEATINVQMKMALDRVAFLPFGRLIDEWRWGVFSGKIAPADYNKAWWELRRRFQGVDAPVARTEEDFDPGAKYHVPANSQYMMYFIARILQFQFHRALCRAAGQTGPLHTCSIYGSAEAGRRFWAMLSMGASKPWPDALEALTGERTMDAGAMLEYFAPLEAWLKKENQGEKCGW